MTTYDEYNDEFDDEVLEGIALLEKHFPDADIWPGHDLFFTREWLSAGELTPVSEHAVEEKKLIEFGKAVRHLWDVYSSMSLQTRKAMTVGTDLRTYSSKHETADLTHNGQSGEDSHEGYATLPSYARIRLNLLNELVGFYAAVHGEYPAKYKNALGDVPEMGLIAHGVKNIRNLQNLHHKRRDAEFQQKHLLIRIAREAWERYTGAPAPIKGTNERYYDFLDDLLRLVGKLGEPGWTIESLMDAHAKFESSEVAHLGGDSA
ncbi:hypothetical protein [Roseovarius aestuarii]|uniref:Uncharacterized protein n=1 Tax=Roseovarius aestuarii TaxID=475083 RepID=A0A1X7BXJ8_9RHOB|nr:hypothetical protein [Roseovarius aestuarii]SMC13989.1 hypothetical protein ROA7745_03851 [Roseovarius aestuarii]